MDWRVKGVVQGALSRIPGGIALNRILQRRLGELRDPARYVDAKVTSDWLPHMEEQRELGFDLRGAAVVEVGTGWLPVFPLCLSLSGAARVHTFDLNRHLTGDAAVRTLALLRRHLPAIAEAARLPEAEVAGRHEALSREVNGASLLSAAGIAYVAPGDATRTGLPDRSVDLVMSNSVLEHIPLPVIDAIMAETVRILSPRGVALHSVNCGDHYAYFDPSITQIHYLRFSEREWRAWNSSIQYQNRLRASDFLASARRAGLRILMDRHRARPELLARLAETPIAEEFRSYPPEDLCCTSIDFAAGPPAAA